MLQYIPDYLALTFFECVPFLGWSASICRKSGFFRGGTAIIYSSMISRQRPDFNPGLCLVMFNSLAHPRVCLGPTAPTSVSLIGENPHADELAPIRMFSPELDFLWVAEFRRNRFDRRLTSSGISQFRREKSFLENIAAQQSHLCAER